MLTRRIVWRTKVSLGMCCALAALHLKAPADSGDFVSLSIHSESSGQPPEDVEEAARQLLELHSRIAWATLARGDLSRAEAMFRDILRRDPDRPNEIAGLAATLARQDKLPESIQVLRDGTRRFPRNAKLASALGQAYLNCDNISSAISWLKYAYALDSGAPDVRYFLGSAYLRWQYPHIAMRYLSGAPMSGREMEWARELAIGVAFSQMELQNEASGWFNHVYRQSQGTPMAQQARDLHRQMDRALAEPSRWHASLKVTERYDTNPGVVPAANSMGGVLSEVPSAGNLYQAQIGYDILRNYNHSLTAGYSFLHTANYDAHQYDLVDNGVYLAAVRRHYWNGMPLHTGFRMDYDNIFVGSDEFLSRFVATPTVSLIDSDFTSSTLLVRYTLYDFLGQGPFQGTPFDLDGDNVSVGIVRQRQFCGRRFTLFGGCYYDHQYSEGRNYDYDGGKLEVGLTWKTPVNDLLMSAVGDLYYRGYDNPNSVIGRAREDLEYMARVSAQYPLREHCLIGVEYNFDRNDSNLFSNDYRRHIIEAGIEYRR